LTLDSALATQPNRRAGEERPEWVMANDPGSSGTGRAELERMAHYREQAQSAENETVPGARHDMARYGSAIRMAGGNSASAGR
jgi:hypothetical protein